MWILIIGLMCTAVDTNKTSGQYGRPQDTQVEVEEVFRSIQQCKNTVVQLTSKTPRFKILLK